MASSCFTSWFLSICTTLTSGLSSAIQNNFAVIFCFFAQISLVSYFIMQVKNIVGASFHHFLAISDVCEKKKKKNVRVMNFLS